MKEIYLGNGCLSAELSKSIIRYNNESVYTSQEVGCVNYEVFSNPDELDVFTSKEIKSPHDGGGDLTTNTVSVELRKNTSFVMMCNAQNKMDSYIRFNINELGEVSFKVIAEECYYTSEFQGDIDGVECTEKQLRDFLVTVKVSHHV